MKFEFFDVCLFVFFCDIINKRCQQLWKARSCATDQWCPMVTVVLTIPNQITFSLPYRLLNRAHRLARPDSPIHSSRV